MKLAIEVNLGNEDMQTPSDVLSAIRGSLDHQRLLRDPLLLGDSGTIRDDNGNTVGRWEVIA